MTDQVGMGRAASVARGSFGVLYWGGLGESCECGGVDLGGRRLRLVVDGAAVDVDVSHVIFHFHFTAPTKFQPSGRNPNRASLSNAVGLGNLSCGWSAKAFGLSATCEHLSSSLIKPTHLLLGFPKHHNNFPSVGS